MAKTKTQFGYHRHPDQDRAGADVAEHAVVVVGAGPVGLSLAIDLAQRGQPVVLLDDADRIGEGSRAICFSKRSLEYWDRLGIGQRMVDKGVVWSVGKIFHGASQLYQFNLLPEEGHKRPAFINLQQFYAEAYLVDRVEELLSQLIERHARVAAPRAWLAKWHVLRVTRGMASDLKSEADLALSQTQRALDNDPTCALALAMEGFVYCHLRRDLETAERRYEAALNRLREPDRELIVGRVELGLEYAELATLMNKPSLTATRVAVSRALIRLAAEMGVER